MKTGDLVRITRASIGVPVNSLALVRRALPLFDTPEEWERDKVIWEVQMLDCAPRTRRYLERDLELLNV